MVGISEHLKDKCFSSIVASDLTISWINIECQFQNIMRINAILARQFDNS